VKAKELEKYKALFGTVINSDNAQIKSLGILGNKLLEHIAEQRTEIERLKDNYNKWADWLHADEFRKEALDLAEHYVTTPCVCLVDLEDKANKFKEKWK